MVPNRPPNAIHLSCTTASSRIAQIRPLGWPSAIAPPTTMIVSWATTVVRAKLRRDWPATPLPTMIGHRSTVLAISHAAMAVTVAIGRCCNWISADYRWWQPQRWPPWPAIRMAITETTFCIAGQWILRRRISMDRFRTVSGIVFSYEMSRAVFIAYNNYRNLRCFYGAVSLHSNLFNSEPHFPCPIRDRIFF